MKIEQIIDSITTATQAGDWAGVQLHMGELRKMMADEGRPLNGSNAFRLVDALSKASPSGITATSNVNKLVQEIKASCAAVPIDMVALKASWDPFFNLLTDPDTNVSLGSIQLVGNALKNARAFDHLCSTADRALARFPEDAEIRLLYAQALVDTGRIHAGIAMADSVLASDRSSAKDHAHGILGRAYKQLYVDHVKGSSTTTALRQKYKDLLRQSLEHYSAAFKIEQPGHNYWHGVNLAAMQTLAREDGHAELGNFNGVQPELIAEKIIGALKSSADRASDPWVLSTIGEAALVLKDYELSSEYYGKFAVHEQTKLFNLASAVRQLEEVWRVHAGSGPAGGALALLKSAQIAKPFGKFSLDGDELNKLRSFAASDEYKHTETMVSGGNYQKLADLQIVVKRAAAVAAVCDESGKTLGTGFLIQGSKLFKDLGDQIYLLTNCHVMSDRNKPGSDPRSLDPKFAKLVMEGADAMRLDFERTAVWQSPISEYDAALFRVVGNIGRIDPLDLSPESGAPLIIDEPGRNLKGTPISVIGYPLGGPLSLSIVGTISGANGVLVDFGARRKNETVPIYLHYKAPTEPGNSGSPVFETQKWTVVGLHHMGFNEFEGRPKLRGAAGTNFANEGVCIRSIAKAIAKEQKSGGFFKR